MSFAGLTRIERSCLTRGPSLRLLLKNNCACACYIDYVMGCIHNTTVLKCLIDSSSESVTMAGKRLACEGASLVIILQPAALDLTCKLSSI